MSPMFLGQAVSDEALQALFSAYRDGQRAVGGDDAVEDGDAVVQGRLEELGITKAAGADMAGRYDAGGNQ